MSHVPEVKLITNLSELTSCCASGKISLCVDEDACVKKGRVGFIQGLEKIKSHFKG